MATATIKGTTKTYKETKKSDCNKDKQVTYEIEWHYTTNLSGKQLYIYTGKEIGKDYFDPGDKQNIRPGDTVKYKKKDHLNDGSEATVTEVTKSLTKKELSEKNLTPKNTFNDSYTLKFKNPPIQEKFPRQYKTIKGVQKVNMEKVPGHKDYICVNSKFNLKNSTRKKIKNYSSSLRKLYQVSKSVLKKEIERQMKRTFKTTSAYDSMGGKEQPVFKVSKVLAKNTYGKKVIDKYELVEPTQNYVISSVSFRDIFKSRRSKSKSVDGEYYKIKVKVHLGLRDTSVKYTSGDNISLALRCDERWNRINDIFREFKDESIEKIQRLFPRGSETKKVKNRSFGRTTRDEEGRVVYDTPGTGPVTEATIVEHIGDKKKRQGIIDMEKALKKGPSDKHRDSKNIADPLKRRMHQELLSHASKKDDGEEQKGGEPIRRHTRRRTYRRNRRTRKKY